MGNSRDLVLLALWAMPGFAIQLAAMPWGVAGAFAGSILCGLLILLAPKVLALTFDDLWPLPLAASLASLFGVACSSIVGQASVEPQAWFAPLLAAVLAGLPALSWLMNGKRCGLCRRALRNVLSFSCPRCSIHICEYCWEFGRERCRLCEDNHTSLLPLESAWWMDRFGERRLAGECSLCRTSAGATFTPQWGCTKCGQNQCSDCWDDRNGICSRCGWTIPKLEELMYLNPEQRRQSLKDQIHA